MVLNINTPFVHVYVTISAHLQSHTLTMEALLRSGHLVPCRPAVLALIVIAAAALAALNGTIFSLFIYFPNVYSLYIWYIWYTMVPFHMVRHMYTIGWMHADCIRDFRVPLMTSLRNAEAAMEAAARMEAAVIVIVAAREAVLVAETADAATVTVLADISGL